MVSKKEIEDVTIQSWLISEISQRLEIDLCKLDIREPFGNFGLSSSEAVILLGDLEEWLGQSISPTLIWDYPTIEALANYLSSQCNESPSSDSSISEKNVEKPGTIHPPGPDAIAIIGMACRFPGAESTEQFWDLLRNGIDGITEIPRDRWNADSFCQPDTEKSNAVKPGKMNSRFGGFLSHVDRFDAGFFGISPREAESMDPQQRLLLEVSWEALENAGQTVSGLAGSATGVFIGMSTNDFSRPQSNPADCLNAYYGTGTACCIASNRLSYFYDLRGPSMALDTACSSSLVAVHQACQSLYAGDCEMALAGGVNVILAPDLHIVFSHAHMLSPDGRCKTFDADANGYVRGEGCGVVVLKPLSGAIRNRDPILAILRGSAMNQDGRSNGLTAPNGPSQEAVIRKALERSGLKPSSISYIEAHGTGTPLGDPIEFESLKNVFKEGRKFDRTLYIGSVKTNIGHLEAAAGIAGLIKSILILRHRQIPPHLHWKHLNPHISLEDFSCAINTECIAIPSSESLMRCGVSSFGFGGTNAHVIVEEYRGENGQIQQEIQENPYLIPISASHPESLKNILRIYPDFLLDHPEISLRDIAYTQSQRRSTLDFRMASVVSTREEWIQRCREAIRGDLRNWSSNRAIRNGKPKVVFVFSGQGGQWWGMGRELIEREALVAHFLESLDRWFISFFSWSILDELKKNEETSLLQKTEVAQPAIFAIQMALAELWRSWGVVPDAVVGHSMGEIAAACVAGALSLEDAMRLIGIRGKAMASAAGKGNMLAVPLSLTEIMKRFHGNPSLSIAAINSPTAIVLSGERQAILDGMRILEREGIHATLLKNDYAFHSSQMAPCQDEFMRCIQPMDSGEMVIPMISTVTGKWIQSQELMNQKYWAENMKEPVLFHPAIETFLHEDYELFLEIGPHPVLSNNIQQTLSAHGKSGTVLSSLQRGRPERATLRRSLGELYTLGISVQWETCHPLSGSFVPLPNYPWNWQSFPRKTGFGLAIHAGLDRAWEESALPKKIHTEWLYQVDWEETPFSDDRATINPSALYVVFCDEKGIGEEFVLSLRQEHAQVLMVHREKGDSYQPDCSVKIDPRSAEEYELLLNKIGMQSVLHIVYLWSLDSTISESEEEEERVHEVQALSSNYLFLLMRAILKRKDSPSWKLWLVTQGAQYRKNCPQEIGVFQTLVWGFGRGFAHESPSLFGGLIDLEREETIEKCAAQILQELKHDQAGQQIVYIKQSRFSPRLSLLLPSTSHKTALPVHRQASYLITGGTGTIGLQLARRFAEDGAGEIILMSRTPFPPSPLWESLIGDPTWSTKIAQIREIESKGVIVHLIAGDVSSKSDLDQLVEQSDREQWAPIRGIVHMAGDLSARTLSQMDEPFLETVLRPKVMGSWMLHRVFQNHALDFMVYFSSASSLFAPCGHAAYSAANAFMDGLAYSRHARHYSAFSLLWGVWEDAGNSARSVVDSFVRNQWEVIDFQSGFDLVGICIQERMTSCVVLPGSWKDWLKYCPELKGDALFSHWVEETRVDVQERDAAISTENLHEILMHTSQEDREGIIRQRILEELAYVVKWDATKIDLDVSLLQLGLDSLMAVELKNRIENSLGIAIPIVKLLEGQNIYYYSRWLLDRWNECTIANHILGTPSSEDIEWESIQI